MSEPRRKKARLPPSKIRLLYYLGKHKDFRGSKVSLSRELGYKGDNRTNINLNELIGDGYVVEEATSEGSSYKLTQEGRKQIQFLLIPDLLLLVIVVIGGLDVYTGMLASSTSRPYQ